MSALVFCVWLFASSVHVTSASTSNVGIRRSVLDFSAAEKEAYLQGLYTMKSTPSKYDASFSTYDYFAWVHRYALDFVEEGAFGHFGWSFLPWHRGFLYLFEQELQAAMNDTNIRLPYWDLSDEESAHSLLDDESFLGGWGDAEDTYMLPNTTRLSCDDWSVDFRLIANNSRAENFTCLARALGMHPFLKELPDADEWFNILDEDDMVYDVEPYADLVARAQNSTQDFVRSFRARIEGVWGLFCNETAYTRNPGIDDVPNMCPFMHSTVHSYIGGHMRSSVSPIDPIFFLLHAWIDAMWALFQDDNGIDYTFPEQYKAVPFFEGYFSDSQMSSNDVMDTTQLGYVYQIQLDLLASSTTTEMASSSSTTQDEKEESSAFRAINHLIFNAVVAAVVTVSVVFV